MSKRKTYEEWLESEDGGIEQAIADAESGADREACYDSDESMEQAYEGYIEACYETDMEM